MKTLKEIKQMPTVHDNVHESIYKSYATLQLVKDMLKRGDSRKSILMVLEDIYTPSEDKTWSVTIDAKDFMTTDYVKEKMCNNWSVSVDGKELSKHIKDESSLERAKRVLNEQVDKLINKIKEE